ncbi:MAG: hypothetical protein GF418_17065 [Chitinivibrionales bacterium]|nr:hypothetical protein [Chitinivibrionales bacterium]MBD3397331.1 hypothetical protein [Chitinivibrionales bacterium]
MSRTHILNAIALAACMPLLMAGSCPTPPPDPRDPLPAPVFTESKTVLECVGGVWEELVYLAWEPPDSDSTVISKYVMLETLPFDTSVDTLGALDRGPQDLPAGRNYTYRPTDDVRRYGSGTVMSLGFRVFAVDIDGQPGDTSEQCSVWLLKSTKPVYPLDTLAENRFEWDLCGLADEINTNILIFKGADTTPVFSGDTIFAFGEGTYSCNTFTDSLDGGLGAGEYTWAIRAQKALPFPGATSFTIGTFYVP